MGKGNESPAPFALPDDLKGLAAEELASLIESARGEFGQIYEAEGGPQAEQLSRARELADAIGKLNAETTRRTEESAATKAEFDKLMESVKPVDQATAEGDGGTEPPAGDQPAAPAPAAPAAPAPVPATVASSTT